MTENVVSFADPILRRSRADVALDLRTLADAMERGEIVACACAFVPRDDLRNSHTDLYVEAHFEPHLMAVVADLFYGAMNMRQQG